MDPKDSNWAHASLEDMAQYQPEGKAQTSDYHGQDCFYKVGSILDVIWHFNSKLSWQIIQTVLKTSQTQ